MGIPEAQNKKCKEKQLVLYVLMKKRNERSDVVLQWFIAIILWNYNHRNCTLTLN